MFSLHLHDLHQGNPRAYRGIGFGSAGSGDADQYINDYFLGS
jgi:hypothetical protein